MSEQSEVEEWGIRPSRFSVPQSFNKSFLLLVNSFLVIYLLSIYLMSLVYSLTQIISEQLLVWILNV